MRSESRAAAVAAMLAAAAMIAQQVAGKATRDALFLSHFSVTTLPAMLIASAVVSIVVVLLFSRAMMAVGPAKLVPIAYVSSAALMLAIWGLGFELPRASAIAVYLHVAVTGPILISGFWSAVTERFDARRAKREIGRIAGFGTLGGLAGGILADRMGSALGVSSMLPVLAALNLCSAVAMRGMGRPRSGPTAELPEGEASTAELLEGYRILSRSPYLRSLGLFVLLGTISAAFLDYIFKANAVATPRGGAELMRVFSVFYTGVALLGFVIQATLSRLSIQRAGIARTVGTLPIAVAGGSLGVMLAPGVLSTGIARAAEAVLRNSLFRSGYELLYTPVPAADKRATKALIDVGFERLGDTLGGGLVQLLLLFGAGAATVALPIGALVLSVAGVWIAFRLHGGYVETLESSMRRGLIQLDPSAVEDTTTLTISRRTRTLEMSQPIDLRLVRARLRQPTPWESQPERAAAPPARSSPPGAATGPGSGTDLDRMLRRLADLRSDDRKRILAALASEEPLAPELAAVAIPLLGRDDVAQAAVASLRRVAPAITGLLVDFMLDQSQDQAVRRRIPRLLVASANERAVQGLFKALEDPRFEVRLQCGRALLQIREHSPEVAIDRDQVFAAVLREAAVEKRVWENQREIDRLDDAARSPFVDRFLRERASSSLAHVFTLLALALPQHALEIAFRGLHTRDEILRGMALEYLESVLPAEIREKLWPYLEERGGRKGPQRPREAILEDLLRSNDSIRISLDALRKLDARRSTGPDPDPTGGTTSPS